MFGRRKSDKVFRLDADDELTGERRGEQTKISFFDITSCFFDAGAYDGYMLV